MMFDLNNPWLSVIIAVAVAVLFYFFLRYAGKMRSEAAIASQVDNADRLLEKDMSSEALEMYNDVLHKKSDWKNEKLYSHIKCNEGICYYNLAKVTYDKARNLERAIYAYEEALKFYTADEFPAEYGMTQNNLGTALSSLAELRDGEDNLVRAVRAYEDALKFYDIQRFPAEYGMTQNNLGTALSSLAELRDGEDNLVRAVHAYEEALKIYSAEKDPVYHNLIMLNLERVRQMMSHRV